VNYCYEQTWYPQQGDGSVKRFWIVAACIFFSCLVAGLMPGSSLRFILGLLIGAALGLFIAYAGSRKGTAKNDELLFSPSVRPDAAMEERSIHEKTARMNQSLRLDPDLDAAVLDAFEGLIDRIRMTAPKALEQFPDSEMTYDLAELGKTHLPGLATRFLALSLEGRNRNQEDLLCRLRDLHEVAEKAGLALDEGRLSDFEAHQDFLKAKFGNV
jgi:hypothetical protein